MTYQGFKYPTRNQDGSLVEYRSSWTPGKKKAGVQGYRLELNGEYSPTIEKWTDAVLSWMQTRTMARIRGVMDKNAECKIVVVLG